MIENWWPTKIGYYTNKAHNTMCEGLVDECYKIKETVSSGGQDWISNKTYNTSNHQYTVHDKSKFKNLNNWILEKVNDYIIETKMVYSVRSIDSWFNIYKKGDYQEVHDHIGNIISCVYFLKSDKDSSQLVFSSNFKDYQGIVISDKNGFNNNVSYPAIQGNLIVFRSFVPHCVQQHKSDNDRITIAYNLE